MFAWFAVKMRIVRGTRDCLTFRLFPAYGISMLKAAFPGSFDPPTLGHLNIILRAADIFDRLTVVVAENRQKKYLFSSAERVFLLKELIRDRKNISVVVSGSLIVDFLREKGIRILIRGVRGMEDFS
jgi:pantetheine-phosphate adenylyltransferase